MKPDFNRVTLSEDVWVAIGRTCHLCGRPWEIVDRSISFPVSLLPAGIKVPPQQPKLTLSHICDRALYAKELAA